MSGSFIEGTYKLSGAGFTDTLWFKVEMTRYPRKAWWITECKWGPARLELLKDTRRRLDDETWKQLETWC